MLLYQAEHEEEGGGSEGGREEGREGGGSEGGREEGREGGREGGYAYASLSTSGAPLRNFLKDFSMIQAAAKEGGLSLALTEATGREFGRGRKEGLEEWDVAAVVKLVKGFEGGREGGREGGGGGEGGQEN
jgi:hypothetical protein